MATVTNALTVVQSNTELAKMYQDSAGLGSENVQGQIPMLKIHTANKSVGNTLINGAEPNDGWFFLSGAQEQFQNPICHVLTISRGYRAEGMTDDKGAKGEPKFNQLLGGVIIDGTEYKPFLMYFTGMRLGNLWNFGKEINKYTHAKPFSVPMFALTVKLSTHKEKTAYGSSYVVDFEIQKNGDFPELVTDLKQFAEIRDMIAPMEDFIKSMILAKEIVKPNENIRDIGSQEKLQDIIIPDDESAPF